MAFIANEALSRDITEFPLEIMLQMTGSMLFTE